MATKKATKKSSSKVSSKKKTTKTTAKKKAINTAPKHHYFIRYDGIEIKSILDLAKQLDDMADDTFYHHVTYERNDFATWVKDVFKEKTLAEQLATTKNKKDSCYCVMRHIVMKK